MTSTSFETGMPGEDAAVKFEVISQIEVERMEARITSADGDELITINSSNDNIESSSKVDKENVNLNRTIHFRPTKKDILKASFT